MMAMIFYYLFLVLFLSFFRWWLCFFLLMFSFFMFFMFFSFSPFFVNLSYFFGFDLLSLSFVLLSIWIISLMILSSFMIFKFNNFINEFLLILMFLLLFLICSFSTMNLFMFYLFFESSIIPTLLIIFGWGYQPERLSSGFYLLFYTLFASFPLLLCIFYSYMICNTFNCFFIYLDMNFYLYLGFILAFLIKMPMFMFHFWLPKAHVEAPVSGSMILAGVLLKLGGYGLLRVMYFMNDFSMKFNYIFIIISLLGSLIIGLVCLYQVDMKSLIAYSSVCHMALVIGGIFCLNKWGLYGSLMLMISHGLCSSCLFCLSNVVYERTMSRSFYINKGLIVLMPSMSLFWFLLSANNMACPPSLNLLGEITLINSIYSWSTLSFSLLFISSFLSCAYSIYLYSISNHGYFYSGMNSINYVNIREFLLVIFHWVPLNFLILKSEYFLLWV
uniref:NADH-ubiquinone oxidoreductase chain 4 n=1 Tax=Helotrephes sp. NKMT027 TaxID=1320099 RepID=C5HIX3_9HEMI|nr:NADH dehydrogenase subunit 4 [Helotrephes sp. NKMT027]ACJ69568.1 NADH dehydrogenase subunit 4 [Helotrephes sp. NKMT027]